MTYAISSQSIEDDDALHALQFAEPALRLLEGASADIVITRPAATRGSIVAQYAVAPDLDPVMVRRDRGGLPRPRSAPARCNTTVTH